MLIHQGWFTSLYTQHLLDSHLVSSLKFAYYKQSICRSYGCTNVFFQGRLSRHITSPSEKTRPESWPGDYMGKATPVWQLSLSHQCNSHSKSRRWKSILIHQGPWFTALYTQHLLDSQRFEFEICILQALNKCKFLLYSLISIFSFINIMKENNLCHGHDG